MCEMHMRLFSFAVISESAFDVAIGYAILMKEKSLRKMKCSHQGDRI